MLLICLSACLWNKWHIWFSVAENCWRNFAVYAHNCRKTCVTYQWSQENIGRWKSWCHPCSFHADDTSATHSHQHRLGSPCRWIQLRRCTGSRWRRQDMIRRWDKVTQNTHLSPARSYHLCTHALHYRCMQHTWINVSSSHSSPVHSNMQITRKTVTRNLFWAVFLPYLPFLCFFHFPPFQFLSPSLLREATRLNSANGPADIVSFPMGSCPSHKHI